MSTSAATASTSAPPVASTPSVLFDTIEQSNPDLSRTLRTVHSRLEAAGVAASAKRLVLAAEHADELGPAELYRFLDPGRVLSELEEVRGKRTRLLSAVRNVLALVPLLLTWVALAYASVEYQTYIDSGKGDIHRPFLILWQEGFGGSTPFTFSFTAGLDFFFLMLILLFTIWAQSADASALRAVRALGDEVDEAIASLISTARAGVIVPRNTDPKDWAAAVQATITRAMNDVQTTIKTALANTEHLITESRTATTELTAEAKSVVQAVGAANTDLMEHQMRPLVSQFRLSVDDLKLGLDAYNLGLGTVSTTISQLGGAATTLATASQALANHASTYSATAASIDHHIQELGAAQTQFVGQVSGAAGDMKRAADAVDTLAVQINDDMVHNLEAASRNLANVNLQVNQTAAALNTTIRQLHATSQVLDKAARNALLARRGLFGWLVMGSDPNNP